MQRKIEAKQPFHSIHATDMEHDIIKNYNLAVLLIITNYAEV